MNRLAALAFAATLSLGFASVLHAESRKDSQHGPAAPGLSLIEEKSSPSGTYRDSAGNMHPWQIGDGHVLVWDGEAYLPAGGVFEPHYWAEGQTDENWKADTDALAALKSSHVQDIYLHAPQGLTHVPGPAVQRLIDYLDKNGFRYGLEIGDSPSDPLTGYVINPSVYRATPSEDASAIKFGDMPGLKSALYTVASTDDDPDVIDVEDAVTDETSALIPSSGAASYGSVVLLYPERTFAPSTPEAHLPDLWQGYDDYRDGLLAYFSHIRLGPGFRFFIDPFTDRIGMNGDVPNLVPTSDGFRIEFQGWLERRYKTVDDLNRAWGIKQRDIPDFATAGRCIALWYGLRGIPWVYDPVKRAGYGVINQPVIESSYWKDIESFKVSSVRDYMNGIANVLKAAVADVPVVFKAGSLSQLFVNDQPKDGFDGLGMVAFGHGEDLQTHSGALVLAMAEQSAHNEWIIASDTAPVSAKTLSASTLPTPEDYASQAALSKDWDDLRDTGARGFYAYALQQLPEEKYHSVNLVSQPEQLGWISGYAANFDKFADVLTHSIPVLWYPAWAIRENPGVRRLSDGAWWLPSFRTGQVVDLGPQLRAYSLDDPDGAIPTIVLWSPHYAMKQISFNFGKSAHPIIEDAAGLSVRIKTKQGESQVPVGDEPILIKNIAKLPLPEEVVNEAEFEVGRLIATADSKRIPIDQYKTEYSYARDSPVVNDDDEQLKFGRYERLIASLTEMMRPYAWIEGENVARNGFDTIVPDADASGGAYLSLDNARQPPILDSGAGRGYAATYNFTVNSAGRYDIWLAGSRLNDETASPFSYVVDTDQAQDVRDLPYEGEPYGNGDFYWTQIGEVTLDTTGKHSLTIVVNTPCSDGRYRLAIDALCVSSVVFHPDGPNPPSIDATPLEVKPPKPPSDSDVNIDDLPTNEAQRR